MSAFMRRRSGWCTSNVCCLNSCLSATHTPELLQVLASSSESPKADGAELPRSEAEHEPAESCEVQRLPDVTKTPGLRRMTEEDAAGVHSLLQAILGKFHLSPMLSLREVEHWLLPRENVIDTYVVQV
ncbi:hypothetical protein CesoFtcFv8_022064 [Champsocephalus esox]|uniref:Glycylpeptide N-tetradecanoyltransferase n=1 Tax=Champsocephalus esox TaxID=159716 RepID=A0AAN8GKY1_9TELE|nr:hypothetical protein CesoFtcFv8_022064 [Champsocephalus esox]